MCAWNKNICTFIVSVGNSSESLLSCCIPDLQFNIFLVTIYSFESKINTDGSHIILIELIISKPK